MIRLLILCADGTETFCRKRFQSVIYKYEKSYIFKSACLNKNRVMLRRRFMDFILGLSGVAVVGGIFYPVFKYLMPPENPGSIPGEVEVGPADKFPKNSGAIFRMGTSPGMLVRTPEGEFKAFSAVCTHLSCTVEYRPDYKDIYCACHAGKYDLNGNNVAGPPPRPLEEYRVEVRKGVVYVRKGEEKA